MRYQYVYDADDEYGQPYRFQGIRATIEAQSVREVVAWLETELPDEAPGGERWSYASSAGLYVWIRDEQDAIHFRMRWC